MHGTGEDGTIPEAPVRIFVSSGPIHKNKVQVAGIVPIIAVAVMSKMRSSCQGCT